MFSKKMSNLLSSTNIIVALSLVAILLLVYLKNKNFELFDESDITTTTIPLLNNDIIQNSSLVNFINRFIVNKNQQNVYVSALATRQNQINNLSEQVINLINPSI